MHKNQEEKLEEITREALVASEAGRWNDVAVLYERRARELSLTNVSPELAQQLIQWDRTVQARARVVQAATQQNIVEVQERRRKLQQLKQGWLRSSVPISRLTRSV